MRDVLHEHRIPSPAELDAWARARHRRDRASGSRQSDGRTGAETRLGKGGVRVGQCGAPLEPVKWRTFRTGEVTGGRGGLGDSLTRTIAARCRELEDAGDALAVIAQRDAEAARLAPRPTAAAEAPLVPDRGVASTGHATPCPRIYLPRIMRYYTANRPHHQGRRQLATTTRKPG